MRVLNYGSLNLDYVFSVEHIVLPGETISSSQRELFPGGKGLNQSIALARAGAEVYHAGAIGPDGALLRETLCAAGVKTDYLHAIDTASGNAIIQVDQNGQNSIVLYAGANHKQTEAAIDSTLSRFGADDILLLQNETNLVGTLIDKGHAKGMTIALNPSPFNDVLLACDLRKVDIFLLNEVEGMHLTGETDEKKILHSLGERFPNSRIILTMGEKGVQYRDAQCKYAQAAFPVKVVDTTAAGDTFTGYFLASLARNLPVADALRIASRASSITVGREGASVSIPLWAEVEAAL